MCAPKNVCAEAPNLHLLGCSLLGNVGEHGSALGRLKVPRARLLKQSLWLRAAQLLARRKLGGCYTHFFMACLILKAANFCVAGDMISSEGETYCCALRMSVLRSIAKIPRITYCSVFMREFRIWRWYSRLLGWSFSGDGVGLICTLVSRALSTLEDMMAVL